jgi:hypothetical protein
LRKGETMKKKLMTVKIYTKYFGNGEKKLFIICDTESNFKTDPAEVIAEVVTGIEIQYNKSKTIIKF